MATAASSSSSPCVSFIEESLILPTRNVRLFQPTFQLIFSHTLFFLAVGVLRVHPLAAAVLRDVDALNSFDPASYIYAVVLDRTQQHAKKLLLVYLAYLASKLTTQVVTVLAASVTCSGERPSFAEMLRCKVVKERIRGPFVTAAFIGVLELTSIALLVVHLTFSWSYTDSGIASFLGLYLLLLLGLLLHLYLGAVFTVSLAVSAAEEDCRGVRALRRAWRLMKARRKEAAVLAVVASLLPVAIYPVYTLALAFARREAVWMLGILYGFVLPSVGVQLYSMVAATVFYYRYCTERVETVPPGPAKVSSDEAAVHV